MPYEKQDGGMFSVTFEVAANRSVQHLTLYTGVLDMLALLGGVTIMLYAIFAIVMSAVNYN